MNMNKKLTLTLMIGFCSTMMAVAQAPYDQFIITWRASGYTTNAAGRLVAVAGSGQQFVNRIAQDNFPNNWQAVAAQLCLVYRAEKRDMAVVYRSTGEFLADVYQVENVFTELTNPPNTTVVVQALLTDEFHDNAIGSLFGIQTKTTDKNGNITSFAYSGNFQYSMPGPPTPLDPEVGTIWIGNFVTGARVPYKLAISSVKPKLPAPIFREARRTFHRGAELLQFHQHLAS